MHLLHIRGDPRGDAHLEITLREALGEDTPPCMILSHRWREEEVLFTDFQTEDLILARSKLGYSKLESCYRIAARSGLRYAWMDTCCIDKSAISELSEVINSMYVYYSQAEVCYAYLDDVQAASAADEDDFQ